MECDINIVDLEVGNRVRISRELSGRSIEATALKLKCSIEEYCQCEAGKMRFKAIQLVMLSKIFEVNLSQFFGGVGVFKTHFDLYRQPRPFETLN